MNPSYLPMDFYNAPLQSQIDSVKYRLEGVERIDSVVDTLRGGVQSMNNGVKSYSEENRLMNELGIQRVRMILESGVNKINHLTKYSDEDRIFRQIKAVMKDFVFELVLNTKSWAPKARTESGLLINPTMDKVRNKRLIVQLVENALLQSMLRGDKGFEADITGKNIQVSETRNLQPDYGGYPATQQPGFLSRFNPFGGGR